MIYLVLGMHKSGTTLIARTLHESGIVMGQEFPAGVDYGKAKYEARWVQQINDRILGADRQVLSSTVTSRLLPEKEPSEEIYELMRSGISQQQEKHENWGFKDPRAVLTYPYWKKVLPPHKLIITYRNPVEVWKRYFRKDRFWQLRHPFTAWCDYNSQLIRYMDKAPKEDILVVNFGSLLANDIEMQRLESFTDSKLTDVRNPAQSKNRLHEARTASPVLQTLQMTLGRDASRIYKMIEQRKQ
ncbi:MAG: sulfotransferase [Thiogranum sp.]